MAGLEPTEVSDVAGELKVANNINLSSWKLKGKGNFEGNTVTQAQLKAGSFIEVLDNSGKIITRFDFRQGYTQSKIMGNDVAIFSGAEYQIDLLMKRTAPLEISANAGVLTFKYSNFSAVTTTNLVDPLANWRNPTKLRLYFFTITGSGDNYYRIMDVSEMRFSKNINSLTPPLNYFRSKTTGSWLRSPVVPRTQWSWRRTKGPKP